MSSGIGLYGLREERGITIKSQCVTLNFIHSDGENYQLNLIDTPGHVDFSYEVSRSLAACKGALLVVDAAQGVEAQSVANCYTAIEQGLEVLPVLNKIDLPQSEPEKVAGEIEDIIGLDTSEIHQVSAKTGQGVDGLLNLIVDSIPAPEGNDEGDLQALIVFLVRQLSGNSILWSETVEGVLQKGDKIVVKSTQKSYVVR